MMWPFDETSLPLVFEIVIFLVSIFIIWFIGFLIKKNLDRVSKKRNYEAKNSIKLIVSLLQFLAVGILFSIIFKIKSDTILSLSALLGTTIGFATSVVIGNVVAGLYLIGVRPFGIGDLILVKGTEGIVMEIGLNYTRLMMLDESFVLIPNKSLLDANLINCSIQINDLEERASMGHEITYQSLMEDMDEQDSNSWNLSEELSEELLGGKEIVRYPFTLQLKLNIVSPDIKLVDVNIRMDDLMKRWHKKLGFKPRFFYNKYIFRQDVRIVLVLHESQKILTAFGEFMEDFYQTIFLELQNKEVS